MKNWFIEHPKSINETYGQHMVFSLRCASRLFIASMAGFIHAIFPFSCVNTCSNIVAKLAGNYCKGVRRDGFLHKLNKHLPLNETCSIKKDVL